MLFNQLALSDDSFEKEKASAVRECIIILLKYGADMYAKRHDGVTAYDWIRDTATKHVELRVLLKKTLLNVQIKKPVWSTGIQTRM
jgi:tetrahydromethanopterin S-methyltransferase subunit H